MSVKIKTTRRSYRKISDAHHSDLPLGNFFRDGYNDQFPFTVRACVEHGSLCVALVTLRIDVTRFLHQLPRHTGVVWVLQQHRLIETERPAASNINLETLHGNWTECDCYLRCLHTDWNRYRLRLSTQIFMDAIIFSARHIVVGR